MVLFANSVSRWVRFGIATDKAAAEQQPSHTHKSTLLTEHWSVLLLSHTPMQRRVGELLGLGLYKTGHTASWSKHFHTRSRRKQEELRTPGAFRNPTLQQTPVRIWNGYLRVGEFSISSAFRTVDSSPQTCWPLQGWSVLTSFNLVQLWMSCVINGSYWRLGGMLMSSIDTPYHFWFFFQQGEKYSAGTKSRVLFCASDALSLLV